MTDNITDGQLESIDEENEEDNNKDIASDGEIHQGIIINSTENVSAQEELPSTTRKVRRECAVCRTTIQNHQRSIQPCSCGYWVHYFCLMSGIQSYEVKHQGCAPLKCKFCFTPYDVWPRKNSMVKVLEKVSVKYRQFSKFGFCALGVVLVDGTFSVIGMGTLQKVYGWEATTELLLSMDPAKAVAVCKSIPLVCIAINSIPWEDKLLRFLRRCSQLPVIGWMFPLVDPHIREKKQTQTRFGLLMGGLMLPLHANVLGFLLFGAVQPKLQRFLLGGVTFLTIKGILQMYYRQKLYARQCSLAVEPYNGE